MMRKLFMLSLVLLFAAGSAIAMPKAPDPATLPLEYEAQNPTPAIGLNTPINTKMYDGNAIDNNMLRRDSEEPIGNVAIGDEFVVGYTYYDYQSNGSVRKQIVRDSHGGVQFIWMNATDVNLTSRHMSYNYLHPLGFDGEVAEGELLHRPNDVPPVDQYDRTGYGMLATYTLDDEDPFLTDIGIGFFHSQGYTGAPNADDVATTVATDFQRSSGAFDFAVLNSWQGSGAIWPAGEVDNQGFIHAFSCEYFGEDADENHHRYGYWRGSYDANNFSFDFPENPVTIDTGSVISQVVATSKTSDKVALSWHKNRIGIYDANSPWAGAAGVWQRNNDLWYLESEDGENWDLDNARSITRIIGPRAELWEVDQDEAYGDTLRPYCDVDMQYDPWNDDLYAVFAASNFKEYAQLQDGSPGGFHPEMGMLWFWNQVEDTLTMIANGHYYNRTDNQGLLLSRAGGWRVNTDRGSIAFNPEDEGTIYVVWVHFPQIMEYNWDEEHFEYFEEAAKDTSLLGYKAAEIMLSISTDYGITWQEGINLTETQWTEDHAADPAEGEFHMSENWVSVATVADDTLHIQYVLDGYAGGVPQTGDGYTEGPATKNPIIYHRVALADIDHDGALVEVPNGLYFHNFLDARPFPTNTKRNPGAPTPDDDVTITVSLDVRGDQELENVILRYTTDPDADDIEVQMEATDVDTIYTASIPAQEEGTQVLYKVEAFNTAGLSGLDVEDYYHSFVVRSEGNLTTVDIQKMHFADRSTANWVNDYSPYRDYEVTVSGVINSGSKFHQNFGAYSMQDRTLEWSGIFLRGIDAALEPGQEITVTGIVRERDPQNMLQWEYATYIDVSSYELGEQNDEYIPDPIVVTANELTFSGGVESLEGMRVQIYDFGIDPTIPGLERSRGIWPIRDNSVEEGVVGWISNNGLSDADAEATDMTIEALNADVYMDQLGGVLCEAFGHYAVTPTVPGDVGELDVENADQISPYSFALEAAYPNPFNSTTRVQFELPMRGFAKLAVYDVNGRYVAGVVEGVVDAGRHQVMIDASSLPTGMYILRLESENRAASQKLVLVK